MTNRKLNAFFTPNFELTFGGHFVAKRGGQFARNFQKSDLAGLPFTYTLDKFNYNIKNDNTYDLDIPIPIMDRWHWNTEKKAFEYSDY